MSYLRVNMVSHHSIEKRDEALNRLNTKSGEIFPEIEMLIAIATGETSNMTISIYEDEAAANRAIATRDEMMKKRGTELEVAFEGYIKAFYQKQVVKAETI